MSMTDLLTQLRAALRADIAVSFRVVLGPDGSGRVVGLTCVGDDTLRAALTAFEGVPLELWRFDLTGLPATNKWVDRNTDTVSAVVRDLVWTPFGLRSQLGLQAVLPAEGPRRQIWGFIGVLRRDGPPYGPGDGAPFPAAMVLDRLQALVDKEPPAPRHPARVVLEDGAVTLAEPGALAHLRAGTRHAELLAALAQPAQTPQRFGWADGAPWEACLLEGEGRGPAWLVTLLPLRRITASVLLHLSPKEREVAEMAAAGATVAEIARAIGRSHNTIKTHLRRIYATTGVATRAELLDLVRDALPPAARTS